MRIITVGLFLILFLIFGMPILGIQWIYGKFNKKQSDLNCLRMVQWALRTILFLAGTKVTVIGEENILTDTPVLYVGNHISFFDVVIAYTKCPGLTGFIGKDSLNKIPLLRTYMKRIYCLFLNRDNTREGLKTILKAIEQIKSGISMAIYPEGKRNDSEELILPFKEGSLKMAEKTGCPIIPMAVTNTREIFENHFPFIKKTNVIIEYCKPIYVNELSKEDKKFLGAYTNNIIKKALIKNQELIKTL